MEKGKTISCMGNCDLCGKCKTAKDVKTMCESLMVNYAKFHLKNGYREDYMDKEDYLSVFTCLLFTNK